MKQIDEINRPRNEELFNNIHKQYQELAKIKTKDEQIKEMAKLFCGMTNGCDDCMFNKVNCYERKDAEELYNAGYRKQSDVASEIFEELIEKLELISIVAQPTDGFTQGVIKTFNKTSALITELKKKYTEAEK